LLCNSVTNRQEGSYPTSLSRWFRPTAYHYRSALTCLPVFFCAEFFSSTRRVEAALRVPRSQGERLRRFAVLLSKTIRLRGWKANFTHSLMMHFTTGLVHGPLRSPAIPTTLNMLERAADGTNVPTRENMATKLTQSRQSHFRQARSVLQKSDSECPLSHKLQFRFTLQLKDM
jgi:hypothetical protein